MGVGADQELPSYVTAFPEVAVPPELASTATHSVVDGQEIATRSSPGSTLSAVDQLPARAAGVEVATAVGVAVRGAAEAVAVEAVGVEACAVGLEVVPPQPLTPAPVSRQATIPAARRPVTLARTRSTARVAMRATSLPVPRPGRFARLEAPDRLAHRR
jgi:hypothetical protein